VVRPAEQPVNSSISIRGIGTFAFSISTEPSVAVQVDDVPVAFQARAFTNLTDIDRLEVLRGPQSTLYGKSASAGLLNIVTKDPTPTLTGRVGALATSDSEFQGNASLSGPLTDTLGFRASVNWDKFLGNVTNVTDGRRLSGREDFSARGKLKWTPTSDLTVHLGLDYVDGHTTLGQPFITISPDARLRGTPALTPAVFAPGITATLGNRLVANDFVGGTRYHDFQQSLRASYDFGFASLMSITSHDFYKMYDRLDNDGTAIAAFNNQQTGTITASQWTQEFRLISASNQPLRYTLGLFYADANFTQIRDRGQVFSLSHYTATAGSLQKAAFGQLEYDVFKNLTAIGGLRYGIDDVSYTFLDRQNGNAYFSGSDERDYVTYKASLRYTFTPDVNVFFTHASGRKGVSYDLSTGFNANRAAAGPVKPETSKDFELGLRSQMFNRRLTFNATLFTADYKNFQAQGIETLPDGTSNFRLANVGAIRTRGVELEANGRATDHLSLGGSLAYVDARIKSFPVAQCYPGQTLALGCVPANAATGAPAFQNLAGARPAQAPVWKASANVDYTHPIGNGPLEATANAAFSYQSAINYSLSQDPATVQGAYGILNLSLGVRSQDRRWEVMGFVNNVTDKQYAANLGNAYGTFGNQLAVTALLPRDFRRYFGVRSSFQF
jgi:iron complex outermembrane receptor protein